MKNCRMLFRICCYCINNVSVCSKLFCFEHSQTGHCEVSLWNRADCSALILAMFCIQLCLPLSFNPTGLPLLFFIIPFFFPLFPYSFLLFSYSSLFCTNISFPVRPHTVMRTSNSWSCIKGNLSPMSVYIRMWEGVKL